MNSATARMTPHNTEGTWWENMVDLTIWAELLPNKAAVVSMKRSESMTNTQKVLQFYLTLADTSKGSVTVTLSNSTSPTITDTWEAPETPRSASTLNRYATELSPAVVRFCKSKCGKKVGDGECW